MRMLLMPASGYSQWPSLSLTQTLTRLYRLLHRERRLLPFNLADHPSASDRPFTLIGELLPVARRGQPASRCLAIAVTGTRMRTFSFRPIADADQRQQKANQGRGTVWGGETVVVGHGVRKTELGALNWRSLFDAGRVRVPPDGGGVTVGRTALFKLAFSLAIAS